MGFRCYLPSRRQNNENHAIFRQNSSKIAFSGQIRAGN